MGKKRRLQDCRTARDFVSFGKRRGADVKEGGRHTKLVTDRGHCAIPRHRGDLRIGTRKAVIKTMIAIGLALVFIVVYAPLWWQG